jgi:imidazolonepropionase-like amidohydrolase
MGWAGRVGSLRPGSFADLVVLAADPLVDVDALRAPSAVIKGGRPFAR